MRKPTTISATRLIGVVLLSIGLIGCYSINGVAGVSYDAQHTFNNPVAEAGFEGNLRACKLCWFYWRHNSGVTEGYPFNDHPDPSSDRFGFEYRVPLWRHTKH